MHNTRSRAAELVGALVIPTGIGAAIGGHAGDATPVAKLLAACCDWLFVHPNVVNASDINELPDNALYVDGYSLDQFFQGLEGFNRCRRQNRILVVYNSPVTQATINAVAAARHTIGADIVLHELETPLTMAATFADDGTASGSVTGVEQLVKDVAGIRYDALAGHTGIDCPPDVEEDYFRDGGVNPWGGVEALASRMISAQLERRVPVAHAPLILDGHSALESLYLEAVLPRMAAEAVSNCFLHCVLKGLHDCPLPDPIVYRSDWTLADLDFIVVPAGALPPHTQIDGVGGTRLIRVRENQTIIDEHLPGTALTPGVFVDNYLEAAGLIACMKAGVTSESVRT